MSKARLAPGSTVFLDRDGTINVGPRPGDYVVSPNEVRLLAGAGEAIRALNSHPAKVVVVTNQRGVSLGKMTEAGLAAVHHRLAELLALEDAHLDAVLHCPHAFRSCDCRKPDTAMFERAVRDVPGVALRGAVMVGDSSIDIEAGQRLGLMTVRLGPSQAHEAAADHDAANLLAAVEWLLE